MNILYVCHRFPYPPKRGGKIRPFNMIAHLHEQGHKVWIASLVRSDQEGAETKGIEAHCHNHFMAQVDDKVQTARMVVRLPTLIPASMGFFYSSKLKEHVDNVLATEKIDLIFVHCSSVAQYVSHVKDIPKILDFGDMDSQKWLSYTSFKPFPLNMGYWWEGVRMERAEKKLAPMFDMCTATTKMEWETLKDYDTGVDNDWFPNGVNAEFFAPDGDDYDSDAISFIGRMDYYPNQECMLEFCQKTLPLLKQKNPNIKLFIVGAEPSKEIWELDKIDGVTVTGSVDDVRPYILRTAVMVAPLNIARGTQNKILEAMAMGVPVVSSGMASGGIDAEPEQHILVADTPEQYCHQIMRLVSDRNFRKQLSDAGRERVLSHHNWQASMKRMDAIIQRCLDNCTNSQS